MGHSINVIGYRLEYLKNWFFLEKPKKINFLIDFFFLEQIFERFYSEYLNLFFFCSFNFLQTPYNKKIINVFFYNQIFTLFFRFLYKKQIILFYNFYKLKSINLNKKFLKKKNINLLYKFFIKFIFIKNLNIFFKNLFYDKKFNINCILIDVPYFKSEFLCRFIILKLKNQYDLKKIVNSLFYFLRLKKLKQKILGIYIRGSGRFTRAERASKFFSYRGKMLYSSITKYIEYYNMVIPLRYGVCSIKIWLSFLK